MIVEEKILELTKQAVGPEPRVYLLQAPKGGPEIYPFVRITPIGDDPAMATQEFPRPPLRGYSYQFSIFAYSMAEAARIANRMEHALIGYADGQIAGITLENRSALPDPDARVVHIMITLQIFAKSDAAEPLL